MGIDTTVRISRQTRDQLTAVSPHARRGLLRPVIDFGLGECVAMVDALRAVDPEKRLGEQVGYISLAELQAIDKALAFVLDLP